jgi:hypothetical protein
MTTFKPYWLWGRPTTFIEWCRTFSRAWQAPCVAVVLKSEYSMISSKNGTHGSCTRPACYPLSSTTHPCSPYCLFVYMLHHMRALWLHTSLCATLRSRWLGENPFKWARMWRLCSLLASSIWSSFLPLLRVRWAGRDVECVWALWISRLVWFLYFVEYVGNEGDRKVWIDRQLHHYVELLLYRYWT